MHSVTFNVCRELGEMTEKMCKKATQLLKGLFHFYCSYFAAFVEHCLQSVSEEP